MVGKPRVVSIRSRKIGAASWSYQLTRRTGDSPDDARVNGTKWFSPDGGNLAALSRPDRGAYGDKASGRKTNTPAAR